MGCPTWCDGRHIPEWPNHTTEAGEVQLSATTVLDVGVAKYGDQDPVVTLTRTDPDETSGDDLSIGQARQLWLLLGEALETLGESTDLPATAEPSFVEVFADGIDLRVECGLCGWTHRGFTSRTEARTAADAHEMTCDEGWQPDMSAPEVTP